MKVLESIRDATGTIAATDFPDAEQNGSAGSIAVAARIFGQRCRTGAPPPKATISPASELMDEQRVARDRAVDADAASLRGELKTIRQRHSESSK